jgi:hypothetical protein
MYPGKIKVGLVQLMFDTVFINASVRLTLTFPACADGLNCERRLVHVRNNRPQLLGCDLTGT